MIHFSLFDKIWKKYQKKFRDISIFSEWDEVHKKHAIFPWHSGFIKWENYLYCYFCLMSENKIPWGFFSFLPFQIKSPSSMNVLNIRTKAERCLETVILVSTNNHLLIKLIKLKKATWNIQGPKSLNAQMKRHDVHEP